MSELDDLLREYRGNLRTRIQVLESLASQCQDPVVSTKIRQIAHQIVGSAGTYGLDELSLLAKTLEKSPLPDFEQNLQLFLISLRANAL